MHWRYCTCEAQIRAQETCDVGRGSNFPSNALGIADASFSNVARFLLPGGRPRPGFFFPALSPGLGGGERHYWVQMDQAGDLFISTIGYYFYYFLFSGVGFWAKTISLFHYPRSRLHLYGRGGVWNGKSLLKIPLFPPFSRCFSFF